MVNHHQVFNSFKCWQGEVKAGYINDFLGIMTRSEYYPPMSLPEHAKTRYVQSSYPSFDEGYFEWIDLLEAVIHSTECFTMIELGAGWGRWLCRGATALKQYNSELPYHLIGVEAEPTHYHWMAEHLNDNNVDLSRCKLLEAAVSDKDGSCRFIVGDAYNSYGQRIASLAERDGRITKVNSVSLQTLLQDLDIVNLIDLDVQGAELKILSSVPRNMWDKVKLVHIGTHSTQLEKGLRKLFTKLGWRNRYDFPMGKEVSTEYGIIYFQDGVQSWTNPRFNESNDPEVLPVRRSWLERLVKGTN